MNCLLLAALFLITLVLKNVVLIFCKIISVQICLIQTVALTSCQVGLQPKLLKTDKLWSSVTSASGVKINKTAFNRTLQILIPILKDFQYPDNKPLKCLTKPLSEFSALQEIHIHNTFLSCKKQHSSLKICAKFSFLKERQHHNKLQPLLIIH